MRNNYQISQIHRAGGVGNALRRAGIATRWSPMTLHMGSAVAVRRIMPLRPSGRLLLFLPVACALCVLVLYSGVGPRPATRVLLRAGDVAKETEPQPVQPGRVPKGEAAAAAAAEAAENAAAAAVAAAAVAAADAAASMVDAAAAAAEADIDPDADDEQQEESLDAAAGKGLPADGPAAAAALLLPKVALMFLTRGPMPHERLWNDWLREVEGLVPSALVSDPPPRGLGCLLAGPLPPPPCSLRCLLTLQAACLPACSRLTHSLAAPPSACAPKLGAAGSWHAVGAARSRCSASKRWRRRPLQQRRRRRRQQQQRPQQPLLEGLPQA